MTETSKQFIINNYLTMKDRELAAALGLKRSTVNKYRRELGLEIPKDVQFKRKSRPCTEERKQFVSNLAKTNENMIKNQFKKGGDNHRSQPIGAKVKETRDGYWKIKVANVPYKKKENWKYLHRIIYEEKYGPIPKGSSIVFLDGDKDNLNIENLYMIDNKIVAVMNKHYKFTGNAEETKSYIELAKLKLAITDAKRRKNEHCKQQGL